MVLNTTQADGAETLKVQILDAGLTPAVDRVEGYSATGARFDSQVSWQYGTPSTDDVTVSFPAPAAQGGAREQEWVLTIENAPSVTLKVRVKRLST